MTETNAPLEPQRRNTRMHIRQCIARGIRIIINREIKWVYTQGKNTLNLQHQAEISIEGMLQADGRVN